MVGSCSYEDDDMATRRDHVIHVSMLVLVALHRVTAGNDELTTGLPLFVGDYIDCFTLDSKM